MASLEHGRHQVSSEPARPVAMSQQPSILGSITQAFDKFRVVDVLLDKTRAEERERRAAARNAIRGCLFMGPAVSLDDLPSPSHAKELPQGSADEVKSLPSVPVDVATQRSEALPKVTNASSEEKGEALPSFRESLSRSIRGFFDTFRLGRSISPEKEKKLVPTVFSQGKLTNTLTSVPARAFLGTAEFILRTLPDVVVSGGVNLILLEATAMLAMTAAIEGAVRFVLNKPLPTSEGNKFFPWPSWPQFRYLRWRSTDRDTIDQKVTRVQQSTNGTAEVVAKAMMKVDDFVWNPVEEVVTMPSLATYSVQQTRNHVVHDVMPHAYRSWSDNEKLRLNLCMHRLSVVDYQSFINALRDLTDPRLLDSNSIAKRLEQALSTKALRTGSAPDAKLTLLRMVPTIAKLMAERNAQLAQAQNLLDTYPNIASLAHNKSKSASPEDWTFTIKNTAFAGKELFLGDFLVAMKRLK